MGDRFVSACLRHAPVSAFVATVFAVPGSALACAPAPAEGQVVRIAEESAIIVWEEGTKTEHFIRRAAFDTQAKDFGFLVPTPTQPSLSSVEGAVFDTLSQATRPKTVERHVWSGVDLRPLALKLLAKGERSQTLAAAEASVTVLEQTQVAGYDAAVLSATSADALAAWLSQHGYAFRPALRTWLAPYIENGWKLTAFKIAGPSTDGEPGARVTTQAVHMAFQTERPFFPYREPSDQRNRASAARQAPRMLRIFFFGPHKVFGSLGAGNPTWPGKDIWAAPLPDSETALGLSGLGDDLHVALNSGVWLNVFEDTASPRPGVAELYFDTAPNTVPVKPPPIIITNKEGLPIPLDVAAVIAGLGFALYKWARRSGETAIRV